ncbi:hypothetical protein C2G38_2056307 [Gigaspora rosea]|uniref:Uncharacterized protein n=1 Tax=Gigaspora rosea TaxID=44941 RepID=A0A397WC87_9GLOM|nr:hypothetical protein C2G38_2056307 [Gigaspora rosea]
MDIRYEVASRPIFFLIFYIVFGIYMYLFSIDLLVLVTQNGEATEKYAFQFHLFICRICSICSIAFVAFVEYVVYV